MNCENTLFCCPIGLFHNPLDFLVDKFYNIDKIGIIGY